MKRQTDEKQTGGKAKEKRSDRQREKLMSFMIHKRSNQLSKKFTGHGSAVEEKNQGQGKTEQHKNNPPTKLKFKKR